MQNTTSKKPIPVGPFIALTLVGAIVAALLVYLHVEVQGGYQVAPSACSIGEHFDCDKVAKSEYSQFFGVPVASVALQFYLAFLIFVVLGREEIRNADRRFLTVIVFLSLMSLIPSVALFLISLIKVHSFCLYCLILDFANIALAVVALRVAGWSNAITMFVQGGIELTRFVFILPIIGGRERNERWISLLSIGAFSLLGFFIVSAPHLLKVTHFDPRQQERNKSLEIVLSAWFEKWDKVLPGNAPELVNTDIGLGGDFFEGNANAQLTIVGFADFQCGYCAKASQIVKNLVAQFGDRVKFVFKNYPLDSSCNAGMTSGGHEFACRAALMARCAGEQGSEFFWEMHDSLFEMPIWTSYVLDQLPDRLGLDQPRFLSCMESAAVLNRVKADIAQAATAGVRSTPTFFVVKDRKQLVAPSFVILDKLIPRLLADEK